MQQSSLHPTLGVFLTNEERPGLEKSEPVSQLGLRAFRCAFGKRPKSDAVSPAALDLRMYLLLAGQIRQLKVYFLLA